MATQISWPYADQTNEPLAETNIRMIRKLLDRKGGEKNLLAYAYGHNFDRKRREANMSLRAINALTGLDTGFLCIFAHGDASFEELVEVTPILEELDLLDHIAWDSLG
jgi:hypothetical protein